MKRKKKRIALGSESPVATSEGRRQGPDGLWHYDCPLGDLGVEPCRCGARALQSEWGAAPLAGELARG